jgi:hypothetical protein
MPDALDSFSPIMGDGALAELDARIKTLDPAQAEALRLQVLQAAQSAKSGKDFLGIAVRVIGSALSFFA